MKRDVTVMMLPGRARKRSMSFFKTLRIGRTIADFTL